MNEKELLYWLDGYLTDKKEGLGGEQVKIIRDKVEKILNPKISKGPYLKPLKDIDSYDILNANGPLC